MLLPCLQHKWGPHSVSLSGDIYNKFICLYSLFFSSPSNAAATSTTKAAATGTFTAVATCNMLLPWRQCCPACLPLLGIHIHNHIRSCKLTFCVNDRSALVVGFGLNPNRNIACVCFVNSSPKVRQFFVCATIITIIVIISIRIELHPSPHPMQRTICFAFSSNMTSSVQRKNTKPLYSLNGLFSIWKS